MRRKFHECRNQRSDHEKMPCDHPQHCSPALLRWGIWSNRLRPRRQQQLQTALRRPRRCSDSGLRLRCADDSDLVSDADSYEHQVRSRDVLRLWLVQIWKRPFHCSRACFHEGISLATGLSSKHRAGVVSWVERIITRA